MHKLSVALNGKELGFLKELSLFGGITYRTSFTVFFTCIFILQNTSFVPFFFVAPGCLPRMHGYFFVKLASVLNIFVVTNKLLVESALLCVPTLFHRSHLCLSCL